MSDHRAKYILVEGYGTWYCEQCNRALGVVTALTRQEMAQYQAGEQVSSVVYCACGSTYLVEDYGLNEDVFWTACDLEQVDQANRIYVNDRRN